MQLVSEVEVGLLHVLVVPRSLVLRWHGAIRLWDISVGDGGYRCKIVSRIYVVVFASIGREIGSDVDVPSLRSFSCNGARLQCCFRVVNEAGQVLFLLSLIAIGREIGREVQVRERVEIEFKLEFLSAGANGSVTGWRSWMYSERIHTTYLSGVFLFFGAQWSS